MSRRHRCRFTALHGGGRPAHARPRHIGPRRQGPVRRVQGAHACIPLDDCRCLQYGLDLRLHAASRNMSPPHALDSACGAADGCEAPAGRKDSQCPGEVIIRLLLARCDAKTAAIHFIGSHTHSLTDPDPQRRGSIKSWRISLHPHTPTILPEAPEPCLGQPHADGRDDGRGGFEPPLGPQHPAEDPLAALEVAVPKREKSRHVIIPVYLKLATDTHRSGQAPARPIRKDRNFIARAP
jgi:hypothetical protein